MKRKLIILTLCFSAGFSAAMAAVAKTFDVNYNNVPIENVISDLRKRSGYEFVYQKNILKGYPAIYAQYKHLTLEQILNRIFVEELNIDYEIVNNTVILSKSEKELPYFKHIVTGTVTDEAGEPLIGATVMLDGTTVGTATDIDGLFTLAVEGQSPRLRVSYVGMKPTVITLSRKQKTVDITLKEDVQMMSEVIVTGYTNFKRESATGSYQTITAADLDQRHSSTIVANLEGKIPGLVTYDKGDGVEMTIRGTGSFQASTSPLVVVDGLPIEGSIESVNPYDIENITVLKDAAAAAIYGARASNGVIVITTKRAKGNSLNVEFNADVTVHENNDYKYLGYASAAEMIELEGYNFQHILSSSDRSAYNSLLNYYRNGRTHLISPATLLMLRGQLGDISASELEGRLNSMRNNDYVRDWQKIVETPRVSQQYNLAIRNNSDKLSSSLALNYERDNNNRHNDYISNLMFSYNGIWRVIPRLKINFGLNILSERSRYAVTDINWGNATSYLPYYSPYGADGLPVDMQGDVPLDNPALLNPAYRLKPMGYNPVTDYGASTQRARRTNIRSYANAVFEILHGWDVSAQFQYEDISYKSDTYRSGDSYAMRSMYNHYTSLDRQTGVITNNIPDGGMLSTSTSDGSYYTFRAQTNYANTIADRHDINAAAGFEFREQHSKGYSNLMLGYDDKTQTNANAMVNWGELKNIAGSASIMGPDYMMYGAPESTEFATSDILHRFYSIYFTGNYVYDTRYTLTGSFRIDKADLFGADPKFRGRPLWSVGGSWNLNNESFLKDTDWLDALKLRLSYGLTGNIANDVSSYLTGTIGINELYGNKYITLDTPPNEHLRWEKTATWNAGVDFSFLSARLTGSVDFYHKSGSDLLTLTDIDPTTGWSRLTINNGRVRNVGVELQLNGDILRAASRRDWDLSVALSLAYNNNKVTGVNHTPETGIEALSPSTLHEGYPVNSLFSYDFAGMVNKGDMQYYSWRDASGNTHISDINNEEFTVADIVYSGSLDPKVIGSLTPTVRWNGFSLSAMFSYYGGHVMRADCNNWTSEGSQYGFSSLSEIDGVPSAYLNYWREGGDKYPANGFAGNSHVIGVGNYGSQTVVPADYMKVRNIVLGYSFDENICRILHLSDLRLRFQINNLATWVRNDLGIDPEANNAISGIRNLKTPRSYTFSLFFSF